MSSIAEYVDVLGKRFNGDSLEELMECFADQAVFVDGQGGRHKGKAAVSAAFKPMYDGSLGKIHFDWTETVIDEAASKAVVTWTLSMTREGAVVHIRGLDIFLFENGLVVSKNSFSKYSAVLLE